MTNQDTTSVKSVQGLGVRQTSSNSTIPAEEKVSQLAAIHDPSF